MSAGNEAWSEAIASCPPNVRTYVTLEVQHPSFAEPARIVAGVGDNMEFGIEDGAAYNAGETVLFIAFPVEVDYPEVREGQPPSSKVKIDNVNRELAPKIRAAVGVRAYLKVIYREYLSSDLTEPAYGPVEFLLKNVQMVGASLTGTAMVAMLLNKRFPRRDKNYNVQDYPSLLP